MKSRPGFGRVGGAAGRHASGWVSERFAGAAPDHRSITIDGTTVGRAVSLNDGGAITLRSSQFLADVTLTRNARSGAKTITGNAIGGKLACTLNIPAPTGSRNVAQGGKYGQSTRV